MARFNLPAEIPVFVPVCACIRLSLGDEHVNDPSNLQKYWKQRQCTTRNHISRLEGVQSTLPMAMAYNDRKTKKGTHFQHLQQELRALLFVTYNLH